MSRTGWIVLAVGSVVILLVALLWPQEEIALEPGFTPIERTESPKPPTPETKRPLPAPQESAAKDTPPPAPLISEPQPQPSKPDEHILAATQDNRGYHRIELVSDYPITGPRTPPSDPQAMQVIAIEGDLGDGYTFRLTLPLYAHEYATDLQLRLLNIFDPQSQSLYADFLYTATTPGRYRLELSRDPLAVIHFEQTARFEKVPEFEIPEGGLPFELR